jgi:hypothetical protein
MSTDGVRKHLRATLDEIIDREKKHLHDFYDKSDANIAKRIEKMSPLIQSLHALKGEIGRVEGVDIDPAPHGHMATVYVNSTTERQAYSISTDTGNTCFKVEERRSYTFGDCDVIEKIHSFESPELALNLVVDAIGKHIAQKQVLGERKQKSRLEKS